MLSFSRLFFLNCLQFPSATLPLDWTEHIPLAIIKAVILVNTFKLPTWMGQLLLVSPINPVLFRSPVYVLGAFSRLFLGLECPSSSCLLGPSRLRRHISGKPWAKQSILDCISRIIVLVGLCSLSCEFRG